MESTESLAVEEFIAAKQIGARIRRLRLKRSMGLVELGRHTGLSASFLSQLETGRVVPTLRNLTRISMVFSKDLSYFFEPEPRSLFQVHRSKDRIRLPQDSADVPAYYFESLGYQVPDRQLDPYWAEFPVIKRNIEAKPHSHPGYEFLFVTEGAIEMKHGDSTEVLGAGDSVYFDASTSHSYRAAGKETARAIIVTSVLMLQTQQAAEKSARKALSNGEAAIPANGKPANPLPVTIVSGDAAPAPSNGNGNGAAITTNGNGAAATTSGNGHMRESPRRTEPAVSVSGPDAASRYGSSPNGAFRASAPARRRKEL